MLKINFQKTKDKKKYIVVFYTIILFSLNIVRIFDNNFWEDEAFTIWLSRMNIANMISETAKDVHPPLYYLIVKFFCKIMGYNGYTYHFISIIPYLLILIILLTFVWKEFGAEAALIVITLSSLSETAIRYNVEVRMYSWGALFIFLSYLEAYKILKNDNRCDYYMLSFFSLCAAYTHYYCLISVAFLYVGIILYNLYKREHIMRTLIMCVVTVLGYLPWLFVLINTFERTSENYWMTVVPSWKACIYYLFSGYFQIYFFYFMIATTIICFLYETEVISKSNTLPQADRVLHFRLNKTVIWIGIGYFIIGGTIAVGIGVSKIFRPMFTPKYVYPVSIIAWLILGIGVSKCRWKKIYTVLLLSLMLCSMIPAYKKICTIEFSENNMVRKTIEATKDITGDNMILLINAPIKQCIMECYYPDCTYIYLNQDDIQELDHSINYWLFLSSVIDEKLTEQLSLQNYSYQTVIENGNLGSNNFCIYKLSHTE